ncbi:N-formylglutamate amidohydrolase [Bizionia gelidisalsuginis]|uniref:N-formylglutamate amidohydrolase n=1 Tax=Bizionia gelidisalsuginis TaxID=291188 RepID=A0ABY3MD25_9FLAO|nr:N-formylglutamate amidohydrolase [Bizionia gelidisalsuginis]TYC16228.1 N-formylglutamate amidohydrolase [Bizionia gelidisalsuginis]
MKLIVTCEHGGKTIPSEYTEYFKNSLEILQSHRGYDFGALDVFNALKTLAVYSNYSATSRLLIELNRSLHHKHLFSEFTKGLANTEKEGIIKDYYFPYRNAVETEIRNLIGSNETVLHLSIHSFTPVFNIIERSCDIGILYDSSRQGEKRWASLLKDHLKTEDSNLNVRYNYPYLGKADGFTTYLRQQFALNYLGIELEINQKFSRQNIMHSTLKSILFHAIKKALN